MLLSLVRKQRMKRSCRGILPAFPRRIVLPRRLTEIAKPGGGRVSLHELAHKVPGKAQKEFERAVRAREKKDTSQEMEHSRRRWPSTLSSWPAQVRLGVLCVEKQRYQQAQTALEQVVRFDHNSELGYTNLAIALLYQERLPQAEEAARRALTLDDSRRNNFVLGIIPGGSEQARRNRMPWIAAADEFPRAPSFVAMRLLASAGETESARVRAIAYLAGPGSGLSAGDRELARGSRYAGEC